jgi:hypothetical protein
MFVSASLIFSNWLDLFGTLLCALGDGPFLVKAREGTDQSYEPENGLAA